jgi:uncharacterized protein (DUF4213/DUF364 family)
MAAMKSLVNDVLDLWCMGATIARIAGVTGLTPEVVEYVINEYGVDVVA